MIRTTTHRGRARRAPLDIGAILLAPVGIAIVFAAQALSGSRMDTLLQYAAALVVFGGTLAALLVTYSIRDVIATVRAALGTFRRPQVELQGLAATLITLASRAHRYGLVSIDADAEAIDEPFLRE